jgi:hypothetical protein
MGRNDGDTPRESRGRRHRAAVRRAKRAGQADSRDDGWRRSTLRSIDLPSARKGDRE